jgi:hypothetical protein
LTGLMPSSASIPCVSGAHAERRRSSRAQSGQVQDTDRTHGLPAPERATRKELGDGDASSPRRMTAVRRCGARRHRRRVPPLHCNQCEGTTSRLEGLNRSRRDYWHGRCAMDDGWRPQRDRARQSGFARDPQLSTPR